jgi:hypothetical protein
LIRISRLHKIPTERTIASMRVRFLLATAIAAFVPGLASAQEQPLPPLPEVPQPAAPEAPPPTTAPAPAPPPEPAPAPVATSPEPESPIHDEPAPPKTALGFGKRASFVFALENVLGFVSEEFSGDLKTTRDQNGFFPSSFGPRIGFHGIKVDSGFTYGVGVSLAWVKFGEANSSSDSSYAGEALFMSLLPRLGLAGSLGPRAGYWVRIGPSFHSVIPTDDRGGDATLTFGLGGEAYLVFTPAEHVGFMVGPIADFGVVGDTGGRSTRLTTLGLEVGLLADL